MKKTSATSAGSRHPEAGLIRRGHSTRTDPELAVRELAAQLTAPPIGQKVRPELNAVIFFCAPSFDLDALSRSLRHHFSCPVIGCTTAGEIIASRGYLRNSLVGIGFASPDIVMTPLYLSSLTAFVRGTEVLASMPSGGGNKFALLLMDGLCMLEERVVSLVHRQLRGIPMVGGSAGDGMHFQQTHVFFQGQFHTNAGVVALFQTTRRFKTFRSQHVTPTQTKVVITESTPENRLVSEINGRPAAREYARITGVSRAELNAAVFAANPLMLKIGDEYFVRSIKKVNPDESLTFSCAIASGLVLTMARGGNLLENLQNQLDQLSHELPDMELILAFDCILRRIELEQRQETEALTSILAPFPYIGLNTYGEQCGGIHVNQTLTGLALGGPNG